MTGDSTQPMGGSGHTIVCGLEGLGLRVAESLLRLDERVVIVAERPDPRRLRRARNAGARFVSGETSDLLELQGVDLHKARCLVLTDNADLANLHAAMAARDVNPDILLVIRMFNDGLARRTAQLLARSRTISASREAAPHFAAAALDLTMTPTRLVWGRYFAVDEDEGDLALPLASNRTRRLLEAIPLRMGEARRQPIDLGEGQALVTVEPPVPVPKRRRRRWTRLARTRDILMAFFDARLALTVSVVAALFGVTTVLMHANGNLGWAEALLRASTSAMGNSDPTFGPPWLKVYQAGFMFATAGILATFFALVADAVVGSRIRETLGEPRRGMRDHAVVIGLGTVGYRISRQLQDVGMDVAALDSRPQNRFISLARRRGIPVLVGDGRFRDNLHQLSTDTARVVLAVTDDDLVNLEAALLAKDLNPKVKVVARLFDAALAERAQRQLGIDVCRSMSMLAAPAFVAATFGEGGLSTLERGGRLWLLAEQPIEEGSDAAGSKITELEQPGDVQVLAVRSKAGERWSPDRGLPLVGGDSVLMACSREGWTRVKELASAAAPTPS
jgi:Trk K+ transport system NAD-binding subunit